MVKKRFLAGDLFDRTRSKLTLQYSVVLMVFLSLFVIVVYALLYWFIWNDQRTRLNELANSEIRTLQTWVNQESNPNRLPPRSVEDAFSISADQSFYYLLANNGDMQLGDEIQPELRAQVMESIKKGVFKGKGIDKITWQMFDRPATDMQEHPQQGKDARFLVTDRELLWNGERIGIIYIGKEVTFQHDLFRWLLILLITMALLFFVLALWLSQMMSRKAIIPIATAYARQREFVADASHELRTPLSVILASIEALQLETSIDRDPFSNSVLAGMKEEVNSITKLTGGLLQLARSDSGEFVLDRSLFNLREAVVSVTHKLQPSAQAKDIDIKLHTPDELMVEWDEEKLTQLLVLLIDNAVKYTPDKGSVLVSIAVEKEKGTHTLTIEVEDSGIGVSAEALPRIFDRFYRQDKSRTRQTGGHGLGLAIAKNIVDAARGTIHVESTVGEGSTFRVRIPM